LHTNDAAGAVSRLLEMGVEDYLLASSLLGVMAQRLVRNLCRHCRRPVEMAVRHKAMAFIRTVRMARRLQSTKLMGVMSVRQLDIGGAMAFLSYS